MSGIHLNHLICWNDLLELCYVFDDPGIQLPVCECGRIQANTKKTQLQLEHRKYLANKICTALDCKIVGSEVFRKTEKKKVVIPSNLSYELRWKHEKSPHISHFIDAFSVAIKEFANTEREKIADRNVYQPEDRIENYCKDIEQRLREDGKWTKDDKWYNGCSCDLFSVLIENGDSKTLLSFPNKKIEEVLSCQHGGQAVGNNFRFLTHHVMEVYLCTNLIVAAGLQDKPNEWGPMRPDSYFRSSIMYDCDGQTFLYGCRKFLTEEIYMKDFNAMRELCKKCFQFIYFLEILRNESEYHKQESTKSYFFG